MEVLGLSDHTKDAVPRSYVDGGGHFRELRDKSMTYWSANGGGNGVVATVAAVASTAGTATSPTHDLTSRYNSLRRVEYLVTTAATSAIAYLRLQNTCGRGVSGYASSGFDVTLRGGPATGSSTTSGTSRFFMGLRPSGNPTDVNPSTYTNIIGIGYDAADTQLQIMSNDASGTATKVALGASFPKPSTNRSVMYQLDLDCAVAGSSVAYTVTELVSGATASGTISTDLPDVTTLLGPLIYHSVGGTSSVVGIAPMSMFIETSA